MCLLPEEYWILAAWVRQSCKLDYMLSVLPCFLDVTRRPKNLYKKGGCEKVIFFSFLLMEI